MKWQNYRDRVYNDRFGISGSV
jgi:hypothetical protein